MKIADGLYLSTSPDLLRRLLEPSLPPLTRLLVGYSGWGPGQLEAELEASSWLMSDIDRDLIFSTPADRLWEAAIRRLGRRSRQRSRCRADLLTEASSKGHAAVPTSSLRRSRLL